MITALLSSLIAKDLRLALPALPKSARNLKRHFLIQMASPKNPNEAQTTSVNEKIKVLRPTSQCNKTEKRETPQFCFSFLVKRHFRNYFSKAKLF